MPPKAAEMVTGVSLQASPDARPCEPSTLLIFAAMLSLADHVTESVMSAVD
jgi:hypothetical protein